MSATLVFLPGTLCDARVWQESERMLAASLPCRHADYGLASSIAVMASRVLASNPGALIPVGSSMGGIVALEMLRQAPARVEAMALFGVNPGPDTPERRAGRAAQLRYAREKGMGALARDLLAPSWFTGGGPRYADMTASAAAMAGDLGMARLAAQFEALSHRADSWPLLPLVGVPVLVAYGQADRVCPPEMHARTAALLPRARIEEIAGAGHLAPMEQGASCAALLQDWLAREQLVAAAPVR